MTRTTSASRRLLLSTFAVGGAAALSLPLSSALAQSPARTLRIGNQKGLLSILKARGTLEKKLLPLGANVTWTEFTAGPVQLEALNVGAIDFGDVGEAPPIFAQAAGAPLVYVAATVPRPTNEALIVPKGSPIRTIADLKGKKIAYNKGSNVQYFLVKLLEKHGLNYSDVSSVFLPPADARAAFLQGSVDAWLIWDPFLAAAQKGLEAQVLADATKVVNNRGYYFSSRNFAAKNADLLRAAVEEVSAIEQWAASHRGDAATELSGVLGLDRATLELAVNRSAYGIVPVTRDILNEQQQIANSFFDLKLLPKKINLLDAATADLVDGHKA